MPTTHAPTFAGLRPLSSSPLPFAPSMTVRAFLLERDHGNVLVYNAPGTAGDVDGRDIGWHYLNHWHEAMFDLAATAAAHRAPVVVHAADRARTVETTRGAVEPVTFAAAHALGEGFDLVPIPGHTPGATAFLYERGDHRFLFTGDSLMLDADGEWRVAILGDSDRADYLDSLDVIRGLDFDVLVPWAVSACAPFYALTGEADKRARIARIMDRIWNGADR